MSEFFDSEICRSLLDSLPVGLCVVDMHRKIVFWSDGAERITGHPRYEAIGHSCFEEGMLHCNQPGCESCCEECPLARATKAGHPAEGIGFLHHKAGHEVPVRIRAVPVRNAHGSIIGAAETFEEQQAAHPVLREDSQEAACVDEVTGVASRLMMQSSLRESLATFNEVHLPFGVLGFRLEGLDRFRARLGQEAAYALLRVVARDIEGALPRTDFVGRWTDDQFLVILNGGSEEALRSVRERVRRMLASDAIEWWGEKRSLPVASGQAIAEPGDTVESLMQRLQESLDAATASGESSGSQ